VGRSARSLTMAAIVETLIALLVLVPGILRLDDRLNGR
jgi:hypothetical protein